jgi:hypothetical protein
MEVRVVRGPWIGAGVGLLAVLALGLGGCAGHMAGATAEAEPSIVQAAPPPPAVKAPERAAAAPHEAQPKPPRPAATAALPKKPATYSVAAKERPAPRPSQDEASCTGVERCAGVLKSMVARRDRSWIAAPAAPHVLANGVRLFAYRALAPRLSCGELARALTEVEAAARTFSGPVPGVAPAEAGRVRTLSVEVGGELKAERARRCAPGGKDKSVG